MILKNIIIILTCLFTGILPLMAEGPAGPGGKLSGMVTDSASSMPVEFANIALFAASDSSLVTGAISDNNGYFELNDIPDGEYYLVIQFIGYAKRTIDRIVISPEQQKINLGPVRLSISAIQLTETEITAERTYTEYRLDRKVINVSQDISNTGISAAEVLEKSPSVRVDIDGNVSLRGSSNFVVFIDGKPSVLDGNEALQQIPANTIETIEIITNPSVKYDPDGTAGIININLKKEKRRGFSGVADLMAGTGEKYGADLYLNYKTKKFNFYGGIDWHRRMFSGTGTETRETYRGDTTDFRDADNEAKRKSHGLNFKGGLDYYLNEKTTLSFGGEYGTGGHGWDNQRKIHDYTPLAGFSRYYTDSNAFTWDRSFYSVHASYLQQFRQKGHQLRVFAFHSGREGTEKQQKREEDTDEDWNPLPLDPFRLRSMEEGPSKHYRIETDYTKPVSESGKIETGYHFRHGSQDEEYFLETYDNSQAIWVRDDLYTKKTTFNRYIHAVYGIFRHEISGFQYQLGLRGEYTYREVEVLNTNESFLVDRFDYFPSVHISKSINKRNQFMGSYSRRIERPRRYFLEPFETYVDESTRRLGNPALLPEYTDSYELGFLRGLKAGSVSIEAYYRNTTDKITRITNYDSESGLFLNEFVNLNEDRSLGIESAIIYDIAKWFNLNLSGTFYYYQVEDLSGETSDLRSSNNWDGRMIVSFKLPSHTYFQLNAAYNGPGVTAQGRSEGYFYADFTARQEFFNRNFSITLKVSDILASRQWETYSGGVSFDSYQYRKPESRVVTLTLTYRWNNFRKNPALTITGDDGEDGGM
jgi:outer membrane receptor protein involved in Fe transport